MKTAEGRITEKTSGNRGYKSTWLYIPSKLSKDDNFPFEDREKVIVELKQNQLIIKKKFTLKQITKKYGIPDATLPHLIEKKAEYNKNKPFLIFKNKTFSYQEIDKLSNQIANGLLRICKKLNVSSPKVAIYFPNCPEAIISWFAVSKIRGISIPINYKLDHKQLEFILKNSNSDILFIDYEFFNKHEEFISTLSQIKKTIILNPPVGFKFTQNQLDFKNLISKNTIKPNIEIKSSLPLEILYTAGTTGRPKGVIYRNHHTLSGISVGTKLKKIGFGEEDHKIYCPLPLFQAFSRYLVIIPAMYYNASVIISNDFDINRFWEDVEKHNPQGFCYFGAHLSKFMNREPKLTDREHSLKYAFGFGAFKKIWEAFERRFDIQIIEAWSLVESTGLTINMTGSKGGKTGSVGIPARGYELKIIDSNNKELQHGRNNIGEIVTRTKLPIDVEYYNLETKSNTTLDEDGWTYTGDYGYIDNDGFLYFLGRKSDMIKRENEIFFAMDIERVANSHPLIVNSAAFEVPLDNSSEKAIKICIEIKDKGSLSYSEVNSYLKENLAYFMIPRFIEFKNILPSNANELIQKFKL
ncbi:MAG: hypothetical protein EU549_04575, partial [Promethearchaeota archaeon]